MSYDWCAKCGNIGRRPCPCNAFLIWDPDGGLTVGHARPFHGRSIEEALESYARYQCSQDPDWYSIFEGGHEVMVVVDGSDVRYAIFGDPVVEFTSRPV